MHITSTEVSEERLSGGLQGTGKRRMVQLGGQEDYQSQSLGRLLRERDLNTELEG